MNFAKSHHATGAMTIAIATALTLSACGGNSADSAGSGEPAADEVAEGSAHGDFPVTVEHEFGDTTIESEPERVISIGWGDLDNLLALGVTPVGYYTAAGDDELFPWTAELMGEAEAENLGPTTELDFEEIAALDPDLIIAVDGAEIDEENFSILSDIAPTVARPAGTSPWGVARHEGTEQIAEAVGKIEEADEMLNDLDEQWEETRAEHADFEGLQGVSAITYDASSYYAFTTADGRGAFLASLGMHLPEGVAEADDGQEFTLEIAPEEVDMLDGDLVMFTADEEDFDPASGNSLFDRFDAEIMTVTGPERAAIAVDTPPSVSYALENLVPDIAEAVSR